MSKSKSGCRQPETNQILKIEDVAVVSWLAKHFAFFESAGVITSGDNVFIYDYTIPQLRISEKHLRRQ